MTVGRARASHCAQLEEHKVETGKYFHHLQTERLHWQQGKTSLPEEVEKSRALHVAQLDKQQQEKQHPPDCSEKQPAAVGEPSYGVAGGPDIPPSSH